MNDKLKKDIIDIIIKRESLRKISRLSRIFKEPFRTLIYYIFAFFSHIKPYKLTFNTLWGTKMTSYLPEGNTFYYYGYCEANVTNFLIRFIKPKNIVIDVGAHIGYYSMLASALVGEGGEVHSFEPTPWTFQILKQNTKKLTNVTLNNSAVSDKKEIISFLDYGPGYGAYNTANKKGSVLKIKPKTIDINTIILDDYCREKNIKPDFIKLDAEGYEFAILNGMNYILNYIRPLITLEVAGGEDWSDNCKKSMQYLFDKKYKVFEVNLDGHILPHEIQDSYTYDNLLFIPEEKTITL